MKVYIVHYDVAFEYGEVLFVTTARSAAEAFIKEQLDMEAHHNKSFKREERVREYSIQEWTVEE